MINTQFYCQNIFQSILMLLEGIEALSCYRVYTKYRTQWNLYQNLARLFQDSGFSSLVSILNVHPLEHQSFKNKLENIIENCAKYAFRLEKHCNPKSFAQQKISKMLDEHKLWNLFLLFISWQTICYRTANFR